ncbi:Zinc finger domain-containing protein, C3HC4 RING-type [Beauveria brongniartii RCEF 3172]|uniref:Zinc finger domain-containing protein, C3HC4 RING-type n=1 Tax=Beauveria brongniartii RCEF 3172 TaxID=1081107 RepID=A0A167EYL5_9HYPO|nr:Zinc finger domain-containing protein, C3HC4 RING-type [Beauveria brongniartii RCEF 3172]
MDNMDFATHDNTPGPPAPANQMPQSSGEWVAQPPTVQPQWPHAAPFYPQYNPTSPAFNQTYMAAQHGSYLATGASGPSRASLNINQYQMPPSPWFPPPVPHQLNTYSAHSFGSTASPSGQQIQYAPSASNVLPAFPQPQFGFAQQAASTNMQSPPWPVNTQASLDVRLNNPSVSSVPYHSQEALESMRTRHNSQPNQHTQRNIQSRSRPQQTHRHSHSTNTLHPSVVNDRTAPPSSFSERRRLEHTRGRRSGAPRFTVSESRGDWTRQFGGSAVLYPGPQRQATMNHTGSLDEAETRRLQLLRSPSTGRSVVSREALQGLLEVIVDDLANGDRTCMICYNDYGTESPEGVIEKPLRLPKCKHVFGDRCILKWFEDSDSCPYCRDKLQSEPKLPPSSTRAFLDIMRIRGWTAGSEVAEEFYRRIMAGEDVRAYVSVGRSMAERRPPPEDDNYGDATRRTRRRRSSSSSVEPETVSPTQSPASVRRARHRVTPNSSDRPSPTQTGPRPNSWMFLAPAVPESPVDSGAPVKSSDTAIGSTSQCIYKKCWPGRGLESHDESASRKSRGIKHAPSGF